MAGIRLLPFERPVFSAAEPLCSAPVGFKFWHKSDSPVVNITIDKEIGGNTPLPYHFKKMKPNPCAVYKKTHTVQSSYKQIN